ncbi:MAG: right-handed parallel beta-helix repeat-containing protein [Acidobacteriota bacterium]|nr:right-handed parallel beta-helix repeat-containing protein [Acidobacteriota bacterium]
MNKFRFTIKILAIAIFTFAFASMAQAQATRTWVSGVGDDANPCSRTAPCKTFAGAISKTATGGIIDALDPGGFGAITITKSITLDSCCIAGILVSGTNAVNVNGAGIVVNLRHLDIEGVGLGVNGVSITNAASVVIEDCVIFGFTTRGISDTRTVSGSLSVRNTIIKQNGSSGAVVFPGGGAVVKAVFDNCSFVGNGAAGLVAEPNSDVTVFRSVANGNTDAGFFAQGNATANINLESCISSHNGKGINADQNAVVRVSDTQITNNGIGLNPTAGGQISSYGNNNVTANGSGNGPFNGTGITQQ